MLRTHAHTPFTPPEFSDERFTDEYPTAEVMERMERTNELAQELAAAAKRHGGAIAGIVGSAGRKASWEVLDLLSEGRELMSAALRARAEELRRQDRSR
ncbi:hypothetical protein [Nocardia callitridis]|uniref:Uncharacterized protein n=1 Tax=Nocardia callitridis TaxID=648753 RepID=A0ABP9KF59_9NOCA